MSSWFFFILFLKDLRYDDSSCCCLQVLTPPPQPTCLLCLTPSWRRRDGPLTSGASSTSGWQPWSSTFSRDFAESQSQSLFFNRLVYVSVMWEGVCDGWKFLFCLFVFFKGQLMGMFTAALQCCHTASSLAGASTCASISAGCWSGTEGGWSRSSNLFIYLLQTCWTQTTLKCIFLPLLFCRKDDDSCTGFSSPGHLHQLLHDVFHRPRTPHLWSLAS